MVAISATACGSQVTGDTIDIKVAELMAKMTLEEKIGQMNQYNGFYDFTGPQPKQGSNDKYDHLKNGLVGSMLNVRGVENVRAVQKIVVEESRLGIPLIIGFDVVHGYQTQSPIPLAEVASWDMSAIERSAQIAAKEAAVAGINWTFAPMVDVGRDARWGRVMEGAGEDAYLGSLVAAARVKGFQGEDLSDPFTIAACAKHFAAYGWAESGRDYNTSDMSISTLYNHVLPPFKAAKEAGIRTFMNSFNDLNGVPASGDAFLQREILKGDWGFDGFVVSDWGSIGEMVAHGYSKDGEQAAMHAANAGSDMDMESALYVAHLANLVREGKVKESVINDAVSRILRVKFELGLFDDPYKYCDEAMEKKWIGHPDHHAAVLEMAKKSIVLLKNEGNLLPLNENQRAVVIGEFADSKNSPLGSWRLAAEDHSAVSLNEGLNNLLGRQLPYEPGVKVVDGQEAFVFETKINTSDRSGISKAVNAARNADVVIMMIGEHGFQSGEGRSRTNINIPGLQEEMLKAVYKVNKNIVLVLSNGRPLAIQWAADNIPAILETWHLGSQSGNAIAQTLYGQNTPSGKLPMTFPRVVGQVPIYYNQKSTGRPTYPGNDLVFWSHWGDVETTPLYPFGHGLSYTTFEYTNLSIDADTVAMGNTITASVDIKNTGNRPGREVAQLYIQDRFASIVRPVKELKGFQEVTLEPGASETISFEIDKEQLQFYNNDGELLIEPGSFNIWIGGSSATEPKVSFELTR